MKCTKTHLLSVALLFTAAMMGCSSKIKVSLRNSETHEPVLGAQVIAGWPVYSLMRPHTHDLGITDQNGVVILTLAEVDHLVFRIKPFDSLEFDELKNISWQFTFEHPAISSDTDWLELWPRVNIMGGLIRK